MEFPRKEKFMRRSGIRSLCFVILALAIVAAALAVLALAVLALVQQAVAHA